MDQPAEVPAWLRDILVKQSGLEAREVTADARLDADLGLDSLDQVEIVMHVEELKGIEIDVEMIAGDARVCDLLDLIEKTVLQQAGGPADG